MEVSPYGKQGGRPERVRGGKILEKLGWGGLDYPGAGRCAHLNKKALWGTTKAWKVRRFKVGALHALHCYAKMCLTLALQKCCRLDIYFLSSPYGKQGGALKEKFLEKLGQGRLDFPGKPGPGGAWCTSEHQKALCGAQQKHEKWECLNVGMGGALLGYAKMCRTIAV